MNLITMDERLEWIEPDGLGGFASGTATGVRTRRYHALLLASTKPPAGRFVLVNGMEAWIERSGARHALSTQHYAPDVRHPDGASRIVAFEHEPWPTWMYRLVDGSEITQELIVPRGQPVTLLSWRMHDAPSDTFLHVRPLLSGRDIHSTHHENSAFRFDALREDSFVIWQPYPGVPAFAATSNGDYLHDPAWYRNFLYTEERARGLDAVEDLAAPGTFRFDLSKGEAVLILFANTPGLPAPDAIPEAETWAARIRFVERMRRARFDSRLHRAADAYLVQRGKGRSIIAGYPWFGDWGRDTFIALRGLCLATGRLREAGDILLPWAGRISEGMLPNRFTESDDVPEFNSVDAALWFVIAADEWLEATQRAGRRVSARDRKRLDDAIAAILVGHAAGTRFGIRMDEDGLLAAGEPGVQLTWMDAKAGDHVITPRIGKPVEIQALWLNALHIGAKRNADWTQLLQRGRASFVQRFRHDDGWLFDVVDADHVRGRIDVSFRPNQIFAVGGLPFALLEGPDACRVVDAVEQRLLTPIGLRTLAPDEPDYVGRYEGGVAPRDGAYHQGTVWPWLLGPFVDAWLRARHGRESAKAEARERFLAPLLRHLDDAGLGHISEIADGDAPHTPRGCPFQAWSVGEALRIVQLLEDGDA
jgi:predicted glycogen debranching enzyme